MMDLCCSKVDIDLWSSCPADITSGPGEKGNYMYQLGIGMSNTPMINILMLLSWQYKRGMISALVSLPCSPSFA